jgi:hypothetical protein
MRAEMEGMAKINNQKCIREETMKKVKNITLKLIGIVVLSVALVGCALTEKDLKYTWDQMQEQYGKKDIPMPRIIVKDEAKYTHDDYRIVGVYIPKDHVIVLYGALYYDVLIHEFHHALGNTMGEKELAYIDYNVESSF